MHPLSIKRLVAALQNPVQGDAGGLTGRMRACLRRRIAFLPSLVNLRRADTQTLRFANTVSLPFDFPRIRVCVRLSTFMRILIYYGLSQPAS
jgi:hypothetical protein